MTNEALAWAQWWFSPWRQAHEEWDELSQCVGLDDLWRAQHSRASVALNIAPCLPLPPQGAVLQLALASAEQLQQMLALLGHICHRPVDGAVSDAQHLWCLRLSKAITVEALLPGDADPLHLLQAWVEPTVWQRLRLRFPPQRVRRLEYQQLALEDTRGRLDTLWKALVWRVISPNDEDFPSS